MRSAIVVASLLAIAMVAAAAISPGAAGAPQFTDAQATEGMKVYVDSCQSCHGSKLEGLAGPALAGPQFVRKWVGGTYTLRDLHRAITTQMPVGAPGSLSQDQYLAVEAYVLSRNGYTPGNEPLAEANMALVLEPTVEAGAATPRIQRRHQDFPTVPQSVGKAISAIPDDAEIANPKPSDWLMYNHTFDGQRYSTLDQITNKNASKLTATCLVQLGEVGWFQANPVVYDGTMYVTSPYNTYAINAKTCEKLWTRLYPEDTAGVTTPVRVTRGTTIYKGKLYRVTPNGHFLALDAKTGEILWDVLLADVYHGYWLSAAPIAFDGKVIIGEAGADWGANAHIFALDADTGAVVWKFNVIPTGKEQGADTWKSGSEHGGGASWSTYTLNVKEGNLYVSVGNPAPSFNGVLRPGDNLFTDSVIVLDFQTGKLKWYAQQIAHDTHDWDTADAPVVYSLNGKEYMAVGNKAGWLYIYDRSSHKLLSKSVATTQENMDAPITQAGTHHCPGSQGGIEWNGPAFSPREETLFVNAVDWCGTSTLSENRYVEGSMYYDGAYKLDPRSEAKGWTKAFNAATGKTLWSRRSATPMISAITATAGSVLFTGDLNGFFLVLDAGTGNTLFQFNTGGGIAGAAATYLVDGKQYVAITSGNNSRTIWNDVGNMTVVVFSLAQ
jgi:PQQ-dependent dehydrogenase (methanol/ethanol family)